MCESCLFATSNRSPTDPFTSVFSDVEGPSSRIGYLGPTNLTANGQQFYNALFDFGNDFPWGLSMAENTNFYAAWQPVRVNAGVSGTQPSVSGFFINETGLQWTTALNAPGTFNDEFGGWIGGCRFP